MIITKNYFNQQDWHYKKIRKRPSERLQVVDSYDPGNCSWPQNGVEVSNSGGCTRSDCPP